jgi:signal transduction histidine kinase
MTSPSRPRWPWILSSVATLLGVSVIPMQLLIGAQMAGDALFLPVGLLMIVAYSTVGAILASRNPENPIGAIMIVVALAFGLGFASEGYATLALETHPGALPFGAVAAWFGTWVYAVILFGLPLLGLLYPSGRVVGPRWRPVPWIVLGLAALASLGTALTPGLMTPETAFAVENPFGIGGLGPVLQFAGVAGWIGLMVSIPVAIASLVVRYRRSEGEARQQIRWLVFVAIAVIASLLITLAMALSMGEGFERSVGPQIAFGVIFSLIALGVPAAIGVAILKYRLYDLDLVIKKTVVYAILAVLVFGLGTAGAWAATGFLFWFSDSAYTFLFAGIGLGFALWPLRRLATRIADRLVYGRRATPYQVLTEFSGRVAESYAVDDVLERMAQVLADAVGAETSTVWLGAGGRARPGATWPREEEPDGSLPADAIEVRHQGEVLGALSVRMPARDPMTPGKGRLIRDLAAQAGLVLRNAGLIDDLKASRQRLVAAQDQERRRLERNIHDGAQQQLVALAVKLRLVDSLIGKDESRAHALVADLQTESNQALEDLRDLARGIYPPLLADKGLGAALESQARRSPVPVSLEADGIGRYPQEAEAAVYFSCLEALQNVAKYAGASSVTVRLAQSNGSLTFSVSDDGRGFDAATASRGSGLQGIADRLAALGGGLTIRSAPGDGTTVAGRLPIGGSG